MEDPHIRLSSIEAQKQGCICEYGCRTCGMHESRMGNCPSWNPCLMGRAINDDCPLIPKVEIDDRTMETNKSFSGV